MKCLPLSMFAIIGLLAFSGRASATTLLNENFDELTPQLAVTSAGAFSAINGTNVDIVGGALYGSLCATPESGNCVDLDGSGGNPQGVLRSNTAFLLSPGVDYTLSFDLIGSQRGNTTSTTVTFGSYSQTFTLPSSDDTDGIISTSVSVSTAGSYYLTFTSNTPGDEGTLLDNVSITSSAVSTNTPEPATMALIAGALTAFCAFGRLSRKR